MKSRIRAVLFDYGLTLVTFDFPDRCLAGVLRRFAPELASELGPGAPSAETLLEDVLQRIEDDLAEVQGEEEVRDYLAFYAAGWKRAGYEVSSGLLYRILDEEQRCWERSLKLAPTALETLDRLRERGLATGLVSNAAFPPEMMRRQLAGTGLAEKLDAVVFSSEVGRRKPAPEIYRAALERLGVRPEQALFVGDRYREDYEGPRRLGMDAVLSLEVSREVPPAGTPKVATLLEVTHLL